MLGCSLLHELLMTTGRAALQNAHYHPSHLFVLLHATSPLVATCDLP